MRVIAGKFRSRRIAAVPGTATRPTSDRLRETLFDVLTAGDPEKLAGTVWVDAYAGSGAVGLEALSRGADMVYFLESSREAAAVIRRNLASLGISRGYRLMQCDAPSGLRRLEAEGTACDLCFLDPPYALEGAYRQCLEILGGSRLIGRASQVIVEHDQHFDPGEKFGALARYRRLRQGDATLSFYRFG